MGGEWMEIVSPSTLRRLMGAGWRMILLPIRPKLASLSEERRAFGSVIGASQISLSRPYVLNLRRYTRTSPERVQNESRTKIKIKMMNRSMSEAPSQQIIVIVSHPLTVGLVGNRIAMLL